MRTEVQAHRAVSGQPALGKSRGALRGLFEKVEVGQERRILREIVAAECEGKMLFPGSSLASIEAYALASFFCGRRTWTLALDCLRQSAIIARRERPREALRQGRSS